MRKFTACGLLALTILAAGTAAYGQERDDLTFLREPLRPLNADIGQSSVSGLSAGAFMADQFFIANSEDIVGAALFAGGPYNCARGDLNTALGACMSAPSNLTQGVIEQLVGTAQQRAGSGQIDDLSNLADRRLYVFSGTRDTTVRQGVTDRIEDWYELAGMPADNIRYRNEVAAGHALPTDGYGNACHVPSASPWMSDCNLDGAGEALQHIYGPLNAPSPVTATSGTFIEFPQNEFFEPAGLSKPELAARFSFNEFGYAYVPASCEAGAACRAHIVFHGCKQVYDRNPNTESPNDTSNPFGLQMVLKSGFNEWANSNELIVLYPQAQRVAGTPHIPVPGNPRGCFDWWGYIGGTGSTYATKAGPQMTAARAMLERIASGPVNGPLPVVEILSAEQCGHEICLSGRATHPDSADEIASLRVRYDDLDGNLLIDEADITNRLEPDGSFAHRVAWPQDNTVYHPLVVAEDHNGRVGTGRGNAVQVGTPCQDWTASNFAHASAQRAYSRWFWWYFAVGSDDALGLRWSVTSVSEDPAGSGTFRLGSCGA